MDQKYPKNTNALNFAIQSFKKHQQLMSVPIAQLVKALQLVQVYFGPKGLEFKSRPSQKLSLKNLTFGRESYQQVDSEKIITTRYLEEIHSCKFGRKLKQQNS